MHRGCMKNAALVLDFFMEKIEFKFFAKEFILSKLCVQDGWAASPILLYYPKVTLRLTIVTLRPLIGSGLLYVSAN